MLKNLFSRFEKFGKIRRGGTIGLGMAVRGIGGLAQKRIYLDYASVTPVDPRVIEYVSKISKEYPANPSSLYREGVESLKLLEVSRESVARALEVQPDEIIFTSGGTESNNLAIQGVVDAYMESRAQSGPRLHDGPNDESHAGPRAMQTPAKNKPHLIASTIEHPSVRELFLRYEKQGICDVTFISVGVDGIIDLKELKKALRPETILVSVMYVNNEIGTIQPISEVSKIVRQYKKEMNAINGRPLSGPESYPYVHTDACQAVLFCPLRMPVLGVDMMTLDSAKFYGPRSTGALYVRRRLNISAQMIGGSQESDMRAGTENVVGIAGFACGLEIAVKEKIKEGERLAGLRNILIENLTSDLSNEITKIIFNGSYDEDKRVPNNLNICLPGMDAEYAVLRLDAKGVCVSSVTSCRSKNEDSSSYVVEALRKEGGEGQAGMENSLSTDCSKSSLRITLGRFTTSDDIKKASKILMGVLKNV